jgi:hypothetical protein
MGGKQQPGSSRPLCPAVCLLLPPLLLLRLPWDAALLRQALPPHGAAACLACEARGISA